ncbi:hypothetical protein LIA77_05559 [Sarocladium implicatum]|nr:hypothetical protein LIA77_05559 [Sarocladium implicatum]
MQWRHVEFQSPSMGNAGTTRSSRVAGVAIRKGRECEGPGRLWVGVGKIDSRCPGCGCSIGHADMVAQQKVYSGVLSRQHAWGVGAGL